MSPSWPTLKPFCHAAAAGAVGGGGGCSISGAALCLGGTDTLYPNSWERQYFKVSLALGEVVVQASGELSGTFTNIVGLPRLCIRYHVETTQKDPLNKTGVHCRLNYASRGRLPAATSQTSFGYCW